jgi:hypothetical protein
MLLHRTPLAPHRFEDISTHLELLAFVTLLSFRLPIISSLFLLLFAVRILAIADRPPLCMFAALCCNW